MNEGCIDFIFLLVEHRWRQSAMPIALHAAFIEIPIHTHNKLLGWA